MPNEEHAVDTVVVKIVTENPGVKVFKRYPFAGVPCVPLWYIKIGGLIIQIYHSTFLKLKTEFRRNE